MSHDSILFLGAPTRHQLSTTWSSTAIDESTTGIQHSTPAVAWRRLSIPCVEDAHRKHEAPYTKSNDESLIAGQDSSNMSLPTQMPTFAFDMSAVLDLEDIYHLDLPARASLLAAILHKSELTTTNTKSGETVVLSLTLGDATSNGFEVTVWGTQALFIAQHLRRMDVIMLQDIGINVYKHQVVGHGRYGSQFKLLYRIDRRDKTDDVFRPLLVGDLPSERVAAVRDWAMTWIPSDTQPQDTQDC